MANLQNATVWMGETRTFTLACNNAFKQPITDLADVQLRIAGPSGLVFKQTTENGAQLVQGSPGVGAFEVSFTAANGFSPGSYSLETVAVESSGEETVQTTGALTIRQSLQATYP